MYPDTQSEMDAWMKILSGVIDRLKNPGGNKPAGGATSAGGSMQRAPEPAPMPARIEVLPLLF